METAINMVLGSNRKGMGNMGTVTTRLTSTVIEVLIGLSVMTGPTAAIGRTSREEQTLVVCS